MDKVEQFFVREKRHRDQAIQQERKYIPPTEVQFDVLAYDDLNDANKEKVAMILRKSESQGLGYNVGQLLGEIRKYDTSVLDHLIRHAFS